MVIAEMPGITPSVANFARRVASEGFSVVMPHLFGRDGEGPSNKAFGRTLAQVCISREFTLLATKKSSSVTKWLTALAHAEHEAHGGPGVGVVGMCLTGGFALAMMIDPVVVAPVLSQPSLPLGKSAAAKSSVGLSDEEIIAVRRRAEAGTCVVGLRFTGDPLVPAERFDRLREILGEKFIGVEIDSSPNNEWGYPADAHSVLTEGQDNKAGSPATLALEQVMGFFSSNLKG
jgi:dienelactone hydrolase